MRFLLLALLSLFSAYAYSQGSAAGVGQSGGGGFGGSMGGFGGGAGGRFGSAPEGQRPEDDEGENGKLYETRTAILTPGDRVEYKLKVDRGETLFAGATSDAFDPALAIEDAKGKTLAKNDDREEGDQAPFVAFRFTEAGTYTLKVLSYKQAAGGKFTLKLRTFTPSDAPLGRSEHDFTTGLLDERRVDLCIRAKKGVVYDLRQVRTAGPFANSARFVRLIGPNGVERADFDRVVTPDGSPVFQARQDGDYYAEYVAYGPTRFGTDLREVPVVALNADEEKDVELGVGDLTLFDFPVEPKEVVRTTLTGGAFQYSMAAPADLHRGTATSDPAFGYNPSWTYFQLDRDSNKDVVRIFREAGTARVAVRSMSTTPQKVMLRNTRSLPRWGMGEATKGALDVGEVRLFLLASSDSELMRVAVTSPTFKPRLDIFGLDGNLANTLPNGTKHTAADDLYFPKADTFLVRLSCDGYGGSGEFALRRETPVPTPYALGTDGSIAFDGTNFGLFSVDLEAGKRYQLTTEGVELGLRTDLLDDDGTFLTGPVVVFDQVRVQYFVAIRSGRHRLWLRGASGVRHFRLEPHTPPKVGG